MHDHRVDAHGLHQHDVTGEAGLELLALHRVAAVLDHQGLADETADVWQCFGQNLGYMGSGIAIEGHAGLQVRNGKSSERQLQAWFDPQQLRAEYSLDTVELRRAVGLEAQHQHRRGVGGADQAPAVG